MMVVRRSMDYPQLRDMLRGKRVAIFTCNTCARLCNEVGGKDSAERLAARLRKDGVDALKAVSVSAACLMGKVRAVSDDPVVSMCDVIVTLVCDVGSACAGTCFGKDIVNPVESDEFNVPELGKQWQWHANYNPTFGMPTAFGVARVYTYKVKEDYKNLWEVPNLLLQKTPADKFTATAKLRFTAKDQNQMGGIVMMGLNYSALVVKRVGDEFQLQQITCIGADKANPEEVEVLATLKPTAKDKIDYQPAIHEDIFLRMIVNDGTCQFAWSANGKTYKTVGKTFTMKEGKWIGAKIGFVAIEPGAKTNRGWIDADWFRVE